ncbi:hypothetical protein Taro_011377 [Colocasia esculenta]|uniref:Uncharacterized protein n=1 Tax=Colocasia esculenta TaxID=4460 RepID=A0A843U5X7_COLES|nr:hypothetical protein [Colocasia esculenta]
MVAVACGVTTASETTAGCASGGGGGAVVVVPAASSGFPFQLYVTLGMSSSNCAPQRDGKAPASPVPPSPLAPPAPQAPPSPPTFSPDYWNSFYISWKMTLHKAYRLYDHKGLTNIISDIGPRAEHICSSSPPSYARSASSPPSSTECSDWYFTFRSFSSVEQFQTAYWLVKNAWDNMKAGEECMEYVPVKCLDIPIVKQHMFNVAINGKKILQHILLHVYTQPFGNPGLLSILPYLDDLHEMKSANWAAAIHEYLMSVVQQCQEHVKADVTGAVSGKTIFLTGCVPALGVYLEVNVRDDRPQVSRQLMASTSTTSRTPPSNKHVVGILHELLRVSKQQREVIELQSDLLQWQNNILQSMD